MGKMASAVFQGFRFGMLLQLAIGPVCLLVLNTAVTSGYADAFTLVSAVALADALEIALALLGAAALLQKARVKRMAGLLGGVVLMLFGLDAVLGALGLSLLPNIRVLTPQGGGMFWQGLLFTLSNPLTLLFWGGVLTAKVAHNHADRSELWMFAVGCVLSTVCFLSVVALLGGLLVNRIPGVAVQGLNAMVGLALIGFGLRLALRKPDAMNQPNRDNACES
ncbi:MAG TPA: LysE family transporter [Candidatus Limiplasma sp.]|nr:LysE family transporter [Candidatus Limiplasma sp.]HPS81561.1 LysE family transporter [Candidatus Limiplasma sp.]